MNHRRYSFWAAALHMRQINASQGGVPAVANANPAKQPPGANANRELWPVVSVNLELRQVENVNQVVRSSRPVLAKARGEERTQVLSSTA
jgi:hypothetical protein